MHGQLSVDCGQERGYGGLNVLPSAPHFEEHLPEENSPEELLADEHLPAPGVPEGVTELLVRWKAGNQDAFEGLVPLVYQELRRIARYHLRRERPDHTLQSGALVNEAYLRLAGQQPVNSENRMHFLAVSSRLMRQILVDSARARRAAKRGAEHRVDLDVSLLLPQSPGADIEALDDALTALSRMDEQQGRIVELRFFGGLSAEEIAELLGISVSTVKRDWNVAKAWLTRQMRRGSNGSQGRQGRSGNSGPVAAH